MKKGLALGLLLAAAASLFGQVVQLRPDGTLAIGGKTYTAEESKRPLAPWETGWTNVTPRFWRYLDTPIKDIPMGAWADVGKNLYADGAYVMVDYTGCATGKVVDPVWYGYFREDLMNISSGMSVEAMQRHVDHVQEDARKLQEAMITLTSTVGSDPDRHLAQGEGARKYYADVLQAAGLLRACMQAYSKTYSTYVLHDGYKSTTLTREQIVTGYDYMMLTLGDMPGNMMAYVIYVLEDTVTSDRLRSHPLMKEIYEAYDCFKDDLYYSSLYGHIASTSRVQAGDRMVQGKGPDLQTFSHNDFPFK